MQWNVFNGDLERDREGKSGNETDKEKSKGEGQTNLSSLTP